MNRNVIIGIVLVVVVLLFGFIITQSKTAVVESANPKATEAKVTDNAQVPTETQTTSTTVTTTTITDVQATTSKEKMSATIDYTDGGFVPSSVTIAAGGNVTWTNVSSGPMWVASAPHPAHTDYPGFDELKRVEKGGKYTFTFTKAGMWKFHNHVKASDYGAVIVK